MRHEMIFLEGQPIDKVFLLRAGAIKLTHLGLNGEEVITGIAAVGDPVGMTGPSRSRDHRCSAYGLLNGSAIAWDVDTFAHCMESLPTIRRNLDHILFDQLGEVEHRLLEVMTQKVEVRLASILIRLVQKIGTPSDAGIHLSVSQDELGRMTGASPSTICRVLSDWERGGIVTPGRETVILKNVHQLSNVRQREV